MKKTQKTESLPLQLLALGAAAAATRGLLYLLAVDEQNLLARSHPLQWLLILLCTAAAVLTGIRVWKLDGSNRYADNFGPSLSAAVGCWVMAAGILLTLAAGNGMQRTVLVRAWQVSGLAAAVGLVGAGISRKQGRQPFLLTHAVLCLFLALHMVSRYQSWSGNPQAQDWLFSLLAVVGLTLCAYHHCAFCAGAGQRRMFLAATLLTVLLCCAALPHTEYFWLYLGGGVWAYTGLCRVPPVPKREVQPEATPGTE